VASQPVARTVEPMIAQVEPPRPALTAPSTTRIIGLDVARALAMAGMVVVHYVWPDDSGSAVDVFAASMLGRAMPLFMLLGGIGVTLAAERLMHQDRALLLRAVIVFALGLIVDELSRWVAVVLQSYGLFFALAPLFRRLTDRMLLVLAALVAAAGGWTYQVLGTSPRNEIAFDDLTDPLYVIRALLFDGYYPFFPVASFFILGVWIGRLDLRSDRVAGALTVVGLIVGIGSLMAAGAMIDGWGVDETSFEAARQAANVSGFDTTRFFWERILDDTGHGQMPVWVVSAAGTSLAVVGASLLIVPRAGGAVSPVVALGRLALTFYVFQVALTMVVPIPSTTSFGQELLTVAAIYFGFMAAAFTWTRFFRVGPLEALLRVGSGPKAVRPDGR